MNHVDFLSKAGSEGEFEEELNELATKSFDYDPNTHVSLKKVKGIQKEKSIVVLQCRTRSKKCL